MFSVVFGFYISCRVQARDQDVLDEGATREPQVGVDLEITKGGRLNQNNF